MGTIGSAFLGFTRVFGAGDDAPSYEERILANSNLLGWYDANDYISGTAWTDRASNLGDLTLRGNYTHDTTTLSNASFLFETGSAPNYDNGGGAESEFTDSISWDDEVSFTYIEILQPLPNIHTGSSFEFISGTQVRGYTDSDSIRTTATGNGVSYVLDPQSYTPEKTMFVARRVKNLYSNANDKLQVSYADNSSVPLTHYGAGNFTQTGGPVSEANYIFTFLTLRVGFGSSALRTYPGYYVASLAYNSFLTDDEINLVYQYYKPLYGLV